MRCRQSDSAVFTLQALPILLKCRFAIYEAAQNVNLTFNPFFASRQGSRELIQRRDEIRPSVLTLSI